MKQDRTREAFRTKPSIFLDTSVLVAALMSARGGSRALLILGELDAVDLLVSDRVLAELDRVMSRKAAHLRPRVAAILGRAGLVAAAEPTEPTLARTLTAAGYAPDAHVAAAALDAEVDYLASLDRRHLVGNDALALLGLRVGTPGDCLTWLRGES